MDIDYFFYYGKVDQKKEIEANIYTTVLQPQRTMFYYRNFGSEVTDFENKPLSIITKLLLKYTVVKAIANMNGSVTDGSNGTRDLRALTSQNLIQVESKGDEVDINIPFVPLFDTTQSDNIDMSLGGL